MTSPAQAFPCMRPHPFVMRADMDQSQAPQHRQRKVTVFS